MIVMELDQVEIDYCLACHGIWLDAGELEILLGGVQGKAGFLDSFKTDISTKEPRRKCPICLKRMRKVRVGDEGPKVLIDRCRKGHGLWLDKGELEEIISDYGSTDSSDVLALLKGMFGMP
jgi:Zn-finger nucleic acid-binding protein